MSFEVSVDSENGEVSIPVNNNTIDKVIAMAVLMFFFCKKASIKGSGNIKKAAQSINKLEKLKPFTNANKAKIPPTIHLTMVDVGFGDRLLGSVFFKSSFWCDMVEFDSFPSICEF